MLLELEYQLGLKIRPPDPVVLAQSTSLVGQARGIFDQGEPDLFASAVTLLDQALELNPNNTQAITLKDRIQLSSGASTRTVLTTSDQAQFRRAEQAYIDGEYFEALRLVTLLLRNETNASYPPLIDLKRKIDSRI